MSFTLNMYGSVQLLSNVSSLVRPLGLVTNLQIPVSRFEAGLEKPELVY